jgi:hypothetical protein
MSDIFLKDVVKEPVITASDVVIGEKHTNKNLFRGYTLQTIINLLETIFFKLNTISDNDTFAYRNNAGNWVGKTIAQIKDELGLNVVVETRSPGDDDDTYEIGQLWLNTIIPHWFICQDNDAGNAVWNRIAVDAPLNSQFLGTNAIGQIIKAKLTENHTIIGGAEDVIETESVLMPANTVKVNNTAVSAKPTNLLLAEYEVLGRLDEDVVGISTVDKIIGKGVLVAGQCTIINDAITTESVVLFSISSLGNSNGKIIYALSDGECLFESGDAGDDCEFSYVIYV